MTSSFNYNAKTEKIFICVKKRTPSGVPLFEYWIHPDCHPAVKKSFKNGVSTAPCFANEMPQKGFHLHLNQDFKK
jgi:hypothetical protein